MAETPTSTELRKEVHADLIEKELSKHFNYPESEKRQMLLVVWKGTESSRCALMTMNQSRGWVGQFDSLVGYLRECKAAEGVEHDLESTLNSIIVQQVCEHGDFTLPMLLVIWEPNDSAIFKHYWLNPTRAWQYQKNALCRHIEDLCQYTREMTWAQNEYIEAVRQQQKGAPAKPATSKLVLPRH